MITLNLTPFIDNKKKRTAKPPINKNIQKNVTMICEININGNYFATDELGEVHYPFTKESYKVPCSILYAIELYKGKRLERRTLKETVCTKGYIPFAPGIGVVGDVITLNDKSKVFNFKKIIELNSDKARECFLFYRDNYNEIRINYALTHND